MAVGTGVAAVRYTGLLLEEALCEAAEREALDDETLLEEGLEDRLAADFVDVFVDVLLVGVDDVDLLEEDVATFVIAGMEG